MSSSTLAPERPSAGRERPRRSGGGSRKAGGETTTTESTFESSERLSKAVPSAASTSLVLRGARRRTVGFTVERLAVRVGLFFGAGIQQRPIKRNKLHRPRVFSHRLRIGHAHHSHRATTTSDEEGLPEPGQTSDATYRPAEHVRRAFRVELRMRQSIRDAENAQKPSLTV